MEEINKATKGEIYNIDPRAIVVVEGFNSRVDFGDIDTLAEQIKAEGLLNPITVQKMTTEDGSEKYTLVDGERRYRAIMKLISEGTDISRIKANILSKSATKEELYVQQMMRNEGKPFNEYELGILCRKLKDVCGKTNSEIAGLIKKNVGQVSYFLEHLERDERIQELLKTDRIGGSDVRRIYSAHKGNESAAVKEILKIVDKANEKGASKVTLKDLDEDSVYNLTKDSKAILKGLSTLYTYYYKYSNGGKEKFPLNVSAVFKALKTGELINDILINMKNESVKKVD